MSRIRKLGIRGIRNFGPGDDDKQLETISFSHPLTLIFGPNGTGKTTIIECLRYATTGDFPPGGGGKSNTFIHDPLLTHECVVRGLVKLEFCDCRGASGTVSRRMECVQKKASKQFKTLDTTMSRTDPVTQQAVAISGRCADIDLEMSLAMGVSKAMLNYVIFCHQEDSTWPLEDGKQLKERFDKIFESDKYNKAVDTIRKLSKDMKSNLRVTKADKESFRVVLAETKERQKTLRSYENRLSDSVKKVNTILEQLEPLTERKNEIAEVEKHYIKIHTENEKKKTQYALLKEQINELRQNIKVIHEGTIEELSEEIESHSNNIADMNTESETLKQKLRDITNEESRMKIILDKQHVSLGELRQQVQTQEKNIKHRNTNINKLLLDEDLEEMTSDATETDAMACLCKLKGILFKLQANIKDKTVEYEAEEKKLQETLNSLRHQDSTFQSEFVMSKKQVAEKRQEASRIRAQLEEVNTATGKLERLEIKIQDANVEIDTLTATFDVKAVKTDIENEISKRDQLEIEVNQIHKEVALLQQQSALHAELDLHKSALDKKQKDLQKLKNKHDSNLKIILGVDVLPEKELKRCLHRAQEEIVDQIKTLNNEIQTTEREIASIETTKKHKEVELKEKTSELETSKDHITSMCASKDYDEVLLHVKTTIKDLQDSRGIYAYKSMAYKDYIKNLDKPNSCCPLCHRGFENTDDLTEFKTELKEEVNKNPHQLKTCEAKLKVQQKRYDELLQLKPLVDKVKQLEEATLKSLSQQIDDTKKKLSKAYSRIENLQLSLAEPDNKLAQCKDIAGDVVLWDQYASDISKLNQIITNVQSRMPNQVSGKSMKEAQTEEESKRESLHTLRKRIEKLQSTLNSHSEKLQQSRESRNKLVEEKLKLEAGVQKLKQFKEKLEELDTEERSILINIERLQEKRKPISQQLDVATKQLEKTKKKHQEKLEQDREILARKSRKVDELLSLQKEIDESIRRGVVDELNRVEADMQKYEKSAQGLEIKKTELSQKINDMLSKISNQESLKRDMNDNMTLKEKSRVASGLKQAIKDVNIKLGGLNFNDFMAEKSELIEQEEALIREKSAAEGSRAELERSIKQAKQELSQEKYRLAQKKYNSQCAKVIIEEESIENLNAYGEALERAIIEFHEERMATVNKIIRNLWDLIYKGKDTTSIQILTDHTGSTGATKRRVYNYRVVQEKQKVTMDMRGRCSAGQKVLASIIIRMALAETFAKSCGVFALDEPTTNLDEVNMLSLAEALTTIVNIRSKHQKNFQLIVISHDESFVTRLTKITSAKNCWELYRNNIGLTKVKMWHIEDNNSQAGPIMDQDSSEEDENSEKAINARKRKALVAERRAKLKQNLSMSPPCKRKC